MAGDVGESDSELGGGTRSGGDRPLRRRDGVDTHALKSCVIREVQRATEGAPLRGFAKVCS